MSGFIEKRGTYASTNKTRWRARYRGADGRGRSRTFSRRSDAEAWLVGRRAEVASGDWIPPERSRITFREYADQWLELRPGRPSTIAGYRSLLKHHVLPKLGPRPVADIERPQIRRLVAELVKSGKSPNTARNVPERHQGCTHLHR